MLGLKDIVRPLVWFAICYGLLVAAWGVVRQPYRAAFRAGGVVLGAYRAVPITKGHNDTELTIQTNRGRTAAGLSARRFGYMPTTFLLALVVATPLRWRRKRWALLWSLLLIHAFIAVRLMLQLAHARATQHLVEASEAWTQTLDAIQRALYTTNLPMLAPLLIWMLTTLYQSEWLSVRDGSPTDES